MSFNRPCIKGFISTMWLIGRWWNCQEVMLSWRNLGNCELALEGYMEIPLPFCLCFLTDMRWITLLHYPLLPWYIVSPLIQSNKQVTMDWNNRNYESNRKFLLLRLFSQAFCHSERADTEVEHSVASTTHFVVPIM
jgi:hypothetical protein